MQRMPHRDDQARPDPLKTQSFSRYDSPSSKQTPTDPASILTGSLNALTQSPTVRTPDTDQSHSDVFDTQDDDEPSQMDGEEDDAGREGFDQLPIEIQSLMERFLESLSLKSSSAALSIDRLAELYQDFYVHVESHISTHIATCACSSISCQWTDTESN